MTYGQGEQDGGAAPPAGSGQPTHGSGQPTQGADSPAPRHAFGGRATVPGQSGDARRYPQQPRHSARYGSPAHHAGTQYGGLHSSAASSTPGTALPGTALPGATDTAPTGTGSSGTTRGRATTYGTQAISEPYGAVAAPGTYPGTPGVYGAEGAAPRGPAAASRAGGPTRRRLSNTRITRLLGTLAIATLAVVLGFGTYIAFFSSSGGRTNAGPAARDITTQQVDPAPLTPAEVFPAATVTPAAGGQAYKLVKSQQSADCKAAVVGDLASLISTAGCSQVVRATLLSPDQTYVITAGIFNLRDENGAKQAGDAIQASVGATKGRLTGYAAGGASDVIGRAPTQLGWDVQGHFLVYAVVARVDGTPIADAATVRPLIDDLVEKYLKGTVIHARTLPAATPSGRSGKK